MTIKQLKEVIKDLPDHMDVFLGERSTEFKYGLVNGFEVKEIEFFEDESIEHPLSKDTALILTEE